MWKSQHAQRSAVSLDPSWEHDVRAVMQQADCSWFEATQELLVSLDPAIAVSKITTKAHERMHPQDIEILRLRQVLMSIKEHNQALERSMEIELDTLRMQLDKKDLDLAQLREQLSSGRAGSQSLFTVGGKSTGELLERDISVLRHDLKNEEDGLNTVKREIDTANREMELMRGYSTQLEKDVASLRIALERVEGQKETARLDSLSNEYSKGSAPELQTLKADQAQLEKIFDQKSAKFRELLALAGGLKAEYLKLMAQEHVGSGRPAIVEENPAASAGLGMQLSSDGVITIISAVHVGGSAYTQGLGVGDRIISINGRDISGMSAHGVAELIRGPVGTKVVLKIQPAELQALAPLQPEAGCVDVILIRRNAQQHLTEIPRTIPYAPVVHNATTPYPIPNGSKSTSSLFPTSQSRPLPVFSTSTSSYVPSPSPSFVSASNFAASRPMSAWPPVSTVEVKGSEKWVSFPHPLGESVIL